MNVAGQTGATFTSTTLATGDQVTVIMTSNAGGCVSAAPVTSNTLTETVSAAITPSVSIAVDNGTICTGTSATFTATPTNGGATPTYQWQGNGGNVAGQTGANFSSTALAN